jgi:hypothetical protein
MSHSRPHVTGYGNTPHVCTCKSLFKWNIVTVHFELNCSQEADSMGVRWLIDKCERKSKFNTTTYKCKEYVHLMQKIYSERWYWQH